MMCTIQQTLYRNNHLSSYETNARTSLSLFPPELWPGRMRRGGRNSRSFCWQVVSAFSVLFDVFHHSWDVEELIVRLRTLALSPLKQPYHNTHPITHFQLSTSIHRIKNHNTSIYKSRHITPTIYPSFLLPSVLSFWLDLTIDLSVFPDTWNPFVLCKSSYWMIASGLSFIFQKE